MQELGTLSGMRGTPKVRIYEIENNTRKDGLRMGTLYCIAQALGVELGNIMRL